MSDPIQSAISPNRRNGRAVQSIACKSSPFNQNRQKTSTFILSYFHTLNFFPYFHPRHPIRNQRGFTLLEIIVTIIISAVLATILAEVMSGQTWRSYQPVQVIEENLALRAVMDNVTSDYRASLKARSEDATRLITLQDRIRTSGYYWDASDPYTNGVSLEAKATCIAFDTNNNEDPTAAEENCDLADTLLKVTLSVAGTQHQLTALFSR
ncbi:type II secretion system protein [Desulfatitalea tepidiphila]|uniref:type II secretion system protein n=1 Tax=Desulfatitalea tepidiphila TaxID=1185843 RepID=UPI0006B5F755|nr:prepilin-type N-terminal cleavage/methylation domain-containing protein [Desulfatitalea tepidiphila]